MDGLIQLVRLYQEAGNLDQRLSVGDEVIRRIAPDLQLFVISAVPNYAKSADLSQEILLAVAKGLARFQGNTSAEFWAWAYQIARNKVNDHYRRQATEAARFEPMPPEELWRLVEATTGDTPLSPENRIDLQYALDMLSRSKPDCREFLWKHYVLGLDYTELAQESGGTYDSARMKTSRCLEIAQSLITQPN